MRLLSPTGGGLLILFNFLFSISFISTLENTMEPEEMGRLCSVKNPKGQAWSELLDAGDLTFLRDICVSHSPSSITSLQFVYVELIRGEVYPSEKRGREVGTKFNVIRLKKDEHLKSVSGHSWFDASKDRYVLSSLTFGTDKGSYGPYGCPNRDGNEEFNFDVEGPYFLGFHGTTLNGILESFGVIFGIQRDFDDDLY